jgi:hypothetical protein
MFGAKRKSGFEFKIIYLAITGGMQRENNKLNESGDYEHIHSSGKIKF